jgi:hypothetical protein
LHLAEAGIGLAGGPPLPLDLAIVEKRDYKRGLWQKNVFTYERADDGSTHPGGASAEPALDTPSRLRV